MLGVQSHISNPGWDGHLQDFDTRKRMLVGKENFCLPNKPAGTFWTSSWLNKTSDWMDLKEWSEEEREDQNRLWLYDIIAEPRILELRNSQDFLALMDLLKVKFITTSDNPIIDMVHTTLSNKNFSNRLWRRVAQSWDCVHVPQQHQRSGLLIGWDCESTAWFEPQKFLKPHPRLENIKVHGF